MALATKPVSVTVPQSVGPAARSTSLARAGSASSPGGAIDSVGSASGALIEDSSFSAVAGHSRNSRDFSDRSFFSSRQGRDDSPPNPGTGIVNVTSQGFVELLQLRDVFMPGGASEGTAVEKKIRLGHMAGRAVALYEISVEIATGGLNIRGGTVSLTV